MPLGVQSLAYWYYLQPFLWPSLSKGNVATSHPLWTGGIMLISRVKPQFPLLQQGERELLAVYVIPATGSCTTGAQENNFQRLKISSGILQVTVWLCPLYFALSPLRAGCPGERAASALQSSPLVFLLGRVVLPSQIQLLCAFSARELKAERLND